MKITEIIREIEIARRNARTLKKEAESAKNPIDREELTKAYNRSLGASYLALENAEIEKLELERERDDLLGELKEAEGAEVDEIEKELDLINAYIEDLDGAINGRVKKIEGEVSVNAAIAYLAAEVDGELLSDPTNEVVDALTEAAIKAGVLNERATREGLTALFERSVFPGKALDSAVEFRSLILDI